MPYRAAVPRATLLCYRAHLGAIVPRTEFIQYLPRFIMAKILGQCSLKARHCHDRLSSYVISPPPLFDYASASLSALPAGLPRHCLLEGFAALRVMMRHDIRFRDIRHLGAEYAMMVSDGARAGKRGDDTMAAAARRRSLK